MALAEFVDTAPTASSDDLRFTEDISQMMHVPRHISVTGDRREEPQQQQQQRQLEMCTSGVQTTMQVPDRILVAGGARDNGIIQEHTHPRHNPHILQTPPSVLTLEHRNFPSIDTEIDTPEHYHQKETSKGGKAQLEESSNTSATIEKDPLQELKLMKRQLTRMSTQVFELQAEMDNLHSREYGLVCIVAVYFLAKHLYRTFGRR